MLNPNSNAFNKIRDLVSTSLQKLSNISKPRLPPTVVRTFFDIHLKENAITEIDSLQNKYPEVKFYKKK